MPRLIKKKYSFFGYFFLFWLRLWFVKCFIIFLKLCCFQTSCNILQFHQIFSKTYLIKTKVSRNIFSNVFFFYLISKIVEKNNIFMEQSRYINSSIFINVDLWLHRRFYFFFFKNLSVENFFTIFRQGIHYNFI